MSFLHHMNNGTPAVDKWLTVIGGFVSAMTLADVSTGVGVGVGIVTICMITPRAVLNWRELQEANQKRRAAREKAKRLLDDADHESADY